MRSKINHTILKNTSDKNCLLTDPNEHIELKHSDQHGNLKVVTVQDVDAVLQPTPTNDSGKL